MIAPARVAAYEILMAVSKGRDLPAALASARTGLHDDRDRALASEIATGVQRWRAALDHIISQCSKRAITRLDPQILEILRLSVYQLLHLTRVPASAVVDDGVNLVRRAGKKSAVSFVNAVLRTVSRRRQSLPLPTRPSDATDREAVLAYFSVTLSHPRWLAERWFDRFGFEAAEAWLLFNNQAAPVTLRANRIRITPQELAHRLASVDVHVRPGAFAPDALIVESGHPLREPRRSVRDGRVDDADALDGMFIAQDEASQLVPLLAAARPDTRVLDTCASPGGKTTAMAAAMDGWGLLVACDVRQRRIDLLKKTIAATGATNVRVVQADISKPLPFLAPFDTVLVDVPCSGLGTLRRDPDIRWRRQAEDLPAFAAAELTMLQQAAVSVGSNGRLVYATCSSEPEENEAIAAAFLASTRSFVSLDARTAAPGLPAAVVDARGHLRTEPHRHGLEAFFGAVFERTKD